jgi:hypothetical protein
MVRVAMTQQERKELAAMYGFLVDEWTAQQNKAGNVPDLLKQGNGKAGRKTNYRKRVLCRIY